MEEESKEEHITVAVRIRPFLQRELSSGANLGWEIPGPTSIKETNGSRFFVYDQVYNQNVTTEQIFEEHGEKII